MYKFREFAFMRFSHGFRDCENSRAMNTQREYGKSLAFGITQIEPINELKYYIHDSWSFNPIMPL